MRRTLLTAAPILLVIAAPTSSQADAVGAAFGAGTACGRWAPWRCGRYRRNLGKTVLGTAE
jgi:hypothetical protein